MGFFIMKYIYAYDGRFINFSQFDSFNFIRDNNQLWVIGKKYFVNEVAKEYPILIHNHCHDDDPCEITNCFKSFISSTEKVFDVQLKCHKRNLN